MTEEDGNGRLAGKVEAVTGGAAGMGRATALAFAEEGATVSIFDIQEDAGKDTAAQIRASGGEAAFFKCDVTKAADVNAAFDPPGVPVAVRAAGDTEHHQGLPGRQMRRINGTDDLQFL